MAEDMSLLHDWRENLKYHKILIYLHCL